MNEPQEIRKGLFGFQFSNYGEFLDDFPKNPVLEYERASTSLFGEKRPGNIMRMITMHVDYQDPVLVELPWCDESVAYATNNYIDEQTAHAPH